MTEQDHSVRVVSRREAMQGTGLVLGSLVASGSLTETVLAQSGGPSDEISGTVEDESGPVQGATVAAVPHDTSLNALATTTASDGSYIFEQSDLHEGDNLYHVIARDGSEAAPRRGQQNYPFIAAEGPAAIPDSGVFRFTFDDSDTESGTALDAWNNNDGSINGATTGVSGANQTYNTAEAYSFDGTDDHITTPIDYDDYLDGGFTVSAWVYPDSIGNTLHIMGSKTDSTEQNFRIDGGAIALFCWDGSSTTGAFGNTVLSAGTWYHVVGVYDPSDGYSVYLDGSSDGTSTDTTFPSNSTTEYIGVRGGTLDQYFSGAIDDLRFYDKPLTSTEVSNLYNTGSING